MVCIIYTISTTCVICFSTTVCLILRIMRFAYGKEILKFIVVYIWMEFLFEQDLWCRGSWADLHNWTVVFRLDFAFAIHAGICIFRFAHLNREGGARLGAEDVSGASPECRALFAVPPPPPRRNRTVSTVHWCGSLRLSSGTFYCWMRVSSSFDFTEMHSRLHFNWHSGAIIICIQVVHIRATCRCTLLKYCTSCYTPTPTKCNN